MKQLFLNRGKVFWEDVPVPIVEDNNILVKVYYSFISSGTELATINESEKSLFKKFIENSSEHIEKISGAVKTDGIGGTVALIKSKLKQVTALGYSCSGQVVSVGKNIDKFRIGDYVACAGSGFANHAQIVSIPVNLVTKILDKNFIKHASITTIGSIAMQGFRRAQLNLGESVCIYGLGLLGQITAQLCKISGCKVFGIDINKDRLSLAQKNGVDFLIDANDLNIVDQINFYTDHHGVDSTIITAASCNGDIINNSMHITRRKGKVVLVGDVDLNFDRDQFYSKEIDFLISCSYGPGRYDSYYENKGIDYPYPYVRWTENRNMELFVDLLQKNKIDLESLISYEFNFNDIENAYSFLKKGKGLGVIISFDQSDSKNALKDLTEKLNMPSYKEFNFEDDFKKEIFKAASYIIPENRIKTAFIGVGGFAKIKLLPIFFRNKNIELHTIVDTNSNNLLNTARTYNLKKIGNKAENVFVDDEINLVVIATPHKFHFQHALSALTLGKAVFVEKPAVVNFEELERLEKFLKFNENSFYCVDFNRSFAPFNFLIKKELSKRKNPVIINYRMNVEYLPKDHWIQDQENGGRIIGEACHIFELFCFLTGESPVNVSVQAINNFSDDLCLTDNFVATVIMSSGSCCNLIYSSLGNAEMGKERMEIMFDGKSILMSDYKELVGFGLPVSFNKKTNYPDKGHENLITEFLEKARQQNAKPPISFIRILDAMRVSLIVDKLVHKGGGFEYIDQEFNNKK